jgi:NIPSNAP
MAFYELRQYEVRPGKMAEWLTLMEEEIIPLQVAKGMVIPGSFRGESDDSVYVWLRRFESEAEREKLYAAVYEDPHWQTSISPRIGELINRDTTRVQRIVPTSRSVLR